MEMQLAEQLRHLRQDLYAARAALERSQAERDGWRLQCEAQALRHAEFVRRVRQLVKEIE